MTLAQIMTKEPVSVGLQTTVGAAARQMQRSNVGSLPVCAENGKLLGFVTDRDLTLRCLGAEISAQTPVSRVMTRRVVSVDPGWEPKAAEKLMRQENIHRLPVTQDGKLVGIVSMADIVAAKG